MTSSHPLPPHRRIAVIDLGSNSARVVVISSRARFSYHLEDEIREIVRLREGMTAAGLSDAAMQRGLFTLSLFKGFCDSLSVDHVIATATSAVREAANGPAFLQRVEDEVGLKLRILDGHEEAYYGVLGALGAIDLHDGVVLDIGGGSAQLSQVQHRTFARGQALTLGSLALTERFVRNDPIQKSEVKAICAEIERQLDTVNWLAEGKGPLVGLGGTIRNLAKISAAREKFPLPSINGMALTHRSLEQTIKLLCDLPLSQRRRIPGLVRDRADIILPGALVVRAVLNRLGQTQLVVSENGLREGLFFEQFWNQQAAPVVENLREFAVLNLARFYGFQEAHALHVRHLCRRLFEQLSSIHGLGATEREWLDAAALLHDIGTKIRYNDHHKHSQTLILNNGLPGFAAREVAMIALLARFHRKGSPSVGSFDSLLEQGDQQRLQQLSAILRLAEYLERGRNGVVEDVSVRVGENEIEIALIAKHKPTVELWEAQRGASDLLEEALGKAVVFTHAPLVST